MNFDIGDLVTRKSHNNDLIFEITDIIDGICYLKGSNIRLCADSPIEDLNKYENKDDTEEKVEPEPIRERNMGFVPDAFTMRIKETNDFMTVYKLLKSLQAQGEILQFGKLKDVDDYSSFDLILFNMSSQEVITLLSQETSPGVRKNMITGLDDSLKNYDTGTTAVIWYVK